MRKETSCTVALRRRRLLTAEAPLNECFTGTIIPHNRCIIIRFACQICVGIQPRDTVKESRRMRRMKRRLRRFSRFASVLIGGIDLFSAEEESSDCLSADNPSGRFNLANLSLRGIRYARKDLVRLRRQRFTGPWPSPSSRPKLTELDSAARFRDRTSSGLIASMLERRACKR